MQKAADMSDTALAALAADGSGEAFDLLAQRMAPMMHRFAMQYHNVPGIDAEDLLQEGLLALLAAVHAYQPELSAFRTFVASCVRFRMLSLVRRHLPAGDFETPETEEILSVFPDAGQADPASLLIEQEEAQRLYHRLRERLTPLEYRVLTAHLAGTSYKEIAKALAVTEKTVDNALQRVRKKLSKDGLH